MSELGEPAHRPHRLGSMRLTIVVVAFIVLNACGAGLPLAESSSPQTVPATAKPSGSAAPTSTSNASPSSSASGALSPSPTPSTMSSCEMPFVAANQRIYETGEGSGGFLKLPSGAFRADPAGALTQTASGQYFVGASPALPGAFFTPHRSWDAPATRWVPVPGQQVSPDGTSYVYRAGSEVHLVIVATGVDKVIYRQPSGLPPTNWAGPQLLTYVAGGVYISVSATYGAQGGSVISVPADQVGVWRIDPAGGPAIRVFNVSVDGLVAPDSSALWSIADDNASPPTGTLMRYDLKSGQADPWFSVPNSGMDLLGFDSFGYLIVWTYDYQGGLKIWKVSRPSTAVAIDSETYGGNVPYYAGNNFEFGTVVTDQHGVWLGSVDGVFLYDQSGLHKVAEATGIPVGRCA